MEAFRDYTYLPRQCFGLEGVYIQRSPSLGSRVGAWRADFLPASG